MAEHRKIQHLCIFQTAIIFLPLLTRDTLCRLMCRYPAFPPLTWEIHEKKQQLKDKNDIEKKWSLVLSV